MSAPLPRIALSTGEPAGVGPDICIKLAQTSHPVDIVAFGDPDLLQARAVQLGLPLSIQTGTHDERRTQQAGSLRVAVVKLTRPVVAGRLDATNAPYVIDILESATRGCLAGDFDALVTGPVHKGVINDAGIPFSGHTEFLAKLCHAPHPLMLLVAGRLRVALATTHLPLKDVPQAISQESLLHCLRTLRDGLRTRFGIAEPQILVLGLNPHAGEGGHLGREEIEIIGPTCDQLRAEGARIIGPVSADTAFNPARLDGVDAVLAMYHDQGLPVLKYAGFGQAVNVTLGLPIVRTSVDHGTALELAGSGRAEHNSLEAALQMTLAMIRSG
jgi:4-hydroxythreonine-4-phosphate dehydrogenase